MTTPTGQISFSQIIAEFGPSDPVIASPSQSSLGDYRVNQTVGDRNWLLDDGVPTPGNPISFNQLKGKTLNCVVDYSSVETRVNSGSKFDSSATVIGGFKAIPSRSNNSQTKKVYHLVRSTLGATDSESAVALRTSTWDNSTLLLRYIINSTGRLYGRGGVPNGGAGSPAFGIDNSCQIVVESGGEIRGGGGAGGQGGGYSFDSPTIIGAFECEGYGGVGGPGRGYENQTGSLSGGYATGTNGRCTSDTLCNNCDGTGSGSSPNGGGAGGGGSGGEWATRGCDGCDAGSTGPNCFDLLIGQICENEDMYDGTAGGPGGPAIIRVSGTSISLTNNGAISGSTDVVGSFV